MKRFRARSRRTPSFAVNYAVLGLMLAFTLYPLVLVFMNSVKSPEETLINPLGWPKEWLWSNFGRVWYEAAFSRAMLNSLFVATTAAIGVTILAAMAGYSLARLNPAGSGVVTLYLLAGGSLPAQMFLVPLFFLWRKLGLVDSHLGLVLIYLAVQSPFSSYLMRSFFVSLPTDYEDAARVDGASRLQVLRHVMLPLARPGFLTVFLLTWMGTWNEFFFANLFINRQVLQTAALRYVVFSREFYTNWAMTNAAGVILVVPVLFLFLATQETFIKGMTQGGLKF